MLKFTGIGSAFNTELGCNSAYILENGELIIFDCGNTTFSTMKEKGVLDNVSRCSILLSHLHLDHFGSASDLIYYMFFKKGIKVNILSGVFNTSKIDDLLLHYFGHTPEQYVLHDNETSLNRHLDAIKVIAVPSVTHCENMSSYGFLFSHTNSNKVVFFSGDCSEFDELMLSCLDSGTVDIVYHDVCLADYDGNVHFSFRKLEQLFAERPNLKSRIYGMHIDDSLLIGKMKDSGYNVAEVFNG
jgi:ribonuclease BN (tRNA processing enzyme)